MRFIENITSVIEQNDSTFALLEMIVHWNPHTVFPDIFEYIAGSFQSIKQDNPYYISFK
jgi:hypothetical protein